jgi:hypothetical protein
LKYKITADHAPEKSAAIGLYFIGVISLPARSPEGSGRRHGGKLLCESASLPNQIASSRN